MTDKTLRIDAETIENETHAVFAVTAKNERVRISEDLSWNAAQYQWRKLDDERVAGHFPHVKFFAVRSTSDPQWSDAAVSFIHGRRTTSTKGYGNSHGSGWGNDLTGREKAARAAWKALTGGVFHRRAGVGRERESDRPGERTGQQGRGGWFYWPNGVIAAQGLHGLARLCEQRGMIVEGASGRWFAIDLDEQA
jgi:hypothetical protein